MRVNNKLGRTLNDRRLNALVHPFRFLDNSTNLFYLAADYATMAAVVAPTVALCHYRVEWGVPWWLLVPIVAIAMLVVGACQHRLAGLGHEGAHYILMKHRLWNELVSDFLCMFPLFTTTDQYRVIHLGHHEHTNDWQRDPELLNVADTRRMNEFPMTRAQFIRRFAWRLLWLPTLLRYTWDMIYVNALGHGRHTYEVDGGNPRRAPGKSPLNLRVATLLGLVYIALMVLALAYLGMNGPGWALAVAPLALWGAACLGLWLLPERYFFRSKLKPVYSTKTCSALRLGYFTALETVFAVAGFATGTNWAIYFWALWVVPMMTAFPALMLLRDIVQHANADDGKLTNSRVVFCHPLVRWAMFVYGQDIHLTHHLYPAVPHYRLTQLHEMLKRENAEYARYVVECHGLARAMKPPAPTGIDVLEIPTREPEAISGDDVPRYSSAATP